MRTAGTDKPRLWLLGEFVSGDFGPFTMHRTRGGKLICYPRSPPRKPPSPAQQAQRTRWTMAAAQWQLKTKTEKEKWEAASRARSLRIRGYELWVYYYTTGDIATVQTIERQTGLSLL